MKLCNKYIAVILAAHIVIGLFTPFATANQGHVVLGKSSLASPIEHLGVTRVLRDRRGNLWIGSQEGLYRFDGTSLKKFGSGENEEFYLTDSHVTGIVEGHSGEIYVSTYAGDILRWTPSSERFMLVQIPGIAENAISGKLLSSTAGHLWIATNSSLVFYDPKQLSSGEWLKEHAYITSVGGPSAIVEDLSSNIWVGTNSGLFRISPSNQNVTKIDIRGANFSTMAKISALLFATDGTLYIGTDMGEIAQVKQTSGSEIFLIAKLSHSLNDIAKLVFFEERLFAGTENGLFSIAPDLSSSINITDASFALPSSVIDDLHVDQENIWVGTLGGLGTLSISQFESIRYFGRGNSSLVYAFNEYHDGRIWVGTYDGLYVYLKGASTDNKATILDRKIDNIQRGVSAIEILGDEIWIGLFAGGVLVLDKEGKITRKLNLSSSRQVKITRLLKDKNKDSLWIGTYGDGLFKMLDGEPISMFDEGALMEKAVNLIEFAGDGTLFVGALNHLYRYIEKDGTFQYLDFDYGLSGQDPIIYSLKSDNQGDIWIGTKGHGLFRWTSTDRKNESLKLRPPNREILDSGSTIYGIEIDSAGNIWCSTENGILRMDGNGTVTGKFTAGDGLQGDDFNLGAAYSDSSGEIYFGGANGFNVFDPTNSITSRTPPKMAFTKVAFARMESINNFRNISRLPPIPFQERYITFSFTTLDFIDPQKNQYRYKLENFDPDWIDSGTVNSATYSNLPPGDYTFRVEGSNSSGIWNREGVSLEVTVLPPPWLTWWAYTIYGIAACLVFWGMHRIYYSYVIDRKANDLALEMFLAEERADDEMQEQVELQQDLVQSAYEHNISTLALVNDFLDNVQANGAITKGSPEDLANRKRLQVLSYLEECLYFQPGGPTADLHKFSDMAINHLLEASPVDTSTIVSVNDVTAQLIPTSVASPISVIIYELLENVMVHAFEPGSPANYLQVSLHRDREEGAMEDHFVLKVGDSGMGIPVEFTKTAYSLGGLGLVRMLLEKLNGTIAFTVGEGTTVMVSIPAPREI